MFKRFVDRFFRRFEPLTPDELAGYRVRLQMAENDLSRLRDAVDRFIAALDRVPEKASLFERHRSTALAALAMKEANVAKAKLEIEKLERVYEASRVTL